MLPTRNLTVHCCSTAAAHHHAPGHPSSFRLDSLIISAFHPAQRWGSCTPVTSVNRGRLPPAIRPSLLAALPQLLVPSQIANRTGSFLSLDTPLSAPTSAAQSGPNSLAMLPFVKNNPKNRAQRPFVSLSTEVPHGSNLRLCLASLISCHRTPHQQPCFDHIRRQPSKKDHSLP